MTVLLIRILITSVLSWQSSVTNHSTPVAANSHTFYLRGYVNQLTSSMSQESRSWAYLSHRTSPVHRLRDTPCHTFVGPWSQLRESLLTCSRITTSNRLVRVLFDMTEWNPNAFTYCLWRLRDLENFIHLIVAVKTLLRATIHNSQLLHPPDDIVFQQPLISKHTSFWWKVLSCGCNRLQIQDVFPSVRPPRFSSQSSTGIINAFN